MFLGMAVDSQGLKLTTAADCYRLDKTTLLCYKSGSELAPTDVS